MKTIISILVFILVIGGVLGAAVWLDFIRAREHKSEMDILLEKARERAEKEREEFEYALAHCQELEFEYALAHCQELECVTYRFGQDLMCIEYKPKGEDRFKEVCIKRKGVENEDK